ncbi:MAG: 2-oxoglutarate dehydrogenase complex dihydrolipoyllysine-residue succinyltransferase [Bacteroides sp.]|nr:MAG: 2-oxoglutarate dehydrogenase complex dihydrolipoyllysine-residue succinyltransferase [Bacteroides sp.]
MKKEIKIPNVGESIMEVTLTKWLKSNGDYVYSDEPIAEIESEKATFEIVAEMEGYLNIIISANNNIVKIGDLIGDISNITSKKSDIKELSDNISKEYIVNKKSNVPLKESVIDKDNSMKIAPSAKKIIDENYISIDEIKGSGKDDRINKKDVLKYINEKSNIAKKSNSSFDENDKVIPMSNLRKIISKKLVDITNKAAILTTFNEVDMSNIINIRNQYKDIFKKKYGVNLGFMSFFVKASTSALIEYPIINAKIIDNESILYNSKINISIAVSTDKGLIVPVLKDTEKMSFSDIENLIYELSNKARNAKISINDISNGTFTITNGGVFGSMLSTPIINGDQSAILGMHNIVKRPVVVNDQIVIKPIMYLALSYDHRIIDGKEAITFLSKIKKTLEDPINLLINL